MDQIQYEVRPLEVQVPIQYDPSYRSSGESEAVAAFALGILIALAACTSAAWALPRKVGYKGASRWVWFGFLVFPFTTVWALLAFVLVPSPAIKENKKLKEQLASSQKDLEESQKQIERNVKYIRQANIEIQRFKGQSISK